MNISGISVSPEIIEQRRNEIAWAALEIALNDLLLDQKQPLQITRLLGCVKDSISRRLTYLDRSSVEYRTIQSEVSLLESLIKQMEADDCIERADRRIKSVLANMEVVL